MRCELTEASAEYGVSGIDGVKSNSYGLRANT